ncbi:hypothetical protein ACMFMG_000384 [Clarireedia jacksonii]
MELRTLYHVPPKRSSSDEAEYAIPESSSTSTTSTSAAHLTPDSEDGSELYAETDESFQLRTRHSEKEVDDDSTDDEADGGYHDGRRRRGSISTVQSYQLYTPDEERAVVRKLDKKLVLFVAFLYMLSFLDRSNIGNAKIAGLERDLRLDSNKYEWVITVFYIAYILFEWMSILWKIIPAHIYITSIVLSWGIIASLQSIATSFASLLILRTLLGIGEAGFTGIPFYLSFFFKRDELALRTGIFLSAAPLATSFASSLAWGIVKLGKYSPIAPWRLLFLLEGFPSVLVAVIAWHRIPDSPATASYLTRRQKKVAVLRLRNESTSSTPTSKDRLKFSEVISTIADPKALLTSFIFFFTNMSFSSMPIFLPTILRSMGHSAAKSQALSAPPYIVSFIFVLLTAYLSDRFRTRSPFIIFHSLLSSVGYIILTLPLHPSSYIRYMAIYPACIGFFCVITITITWNINNQSSTSRQGIAFAMMQMLGQCGPLIGTRLYPEREAPRYTKGMAVCACVMFGVAGLTAGLRWWLKRENARMESERGGEEREGLVGVGGDRGKKRLGKERGEMFRYML